ncbi:MAG: hypothetical protein KGL39_27595 [Patescibacteria group bacterium]|nr:hypothetical protein [Patescibacteria group bacterium]
MSTISRVQNVTGMSWMSVTAGLIVLAFFLYIAANGSLKAYKQILF